MTDANPALLPCPFCGSAVQWKDSHVADSGEGYINCHECVLSFDAFRYGSKEQTIAAWNTRANPALPAEVENIAKRHQLAEDSTKGAGEWLADYASDAHADRGALLVYVRTLAAQVAGLEARMSDTADNPRADAQTGEQGRMTTVSPVAALTPQPAAGDVERAQEVAAIFTDPTERAGLTQRIATLIAQVRAEEREALTKIVRDRLAEAEAMLKQRKAERSDRSADRWEGGCYELEWVIAAIREGKHHGD